MLLTTGRFHLALLVVASEEVILHSPLATLFTIHAQSWNCHLTGEITANPLSVSDRAYPSNAHALCA